jgi:hypothetical protein
MSHTATASHPPRARRPRSALIALALATPLAAQSWETPADHLGDPRFHQPDYPLVFVATQGHGNPLNDTPPHLGLDVHAVSNPSAHGPGGGLYVLLADGSVEKLFPLPVHESVPGLIDTPLGELANGAVAEPTVSEDGRALYFAYFHDATWEPSGGGFQSRKLSFKGSDLYRLEVGALLDDPSFEAGELPIRRLTFKQYTGPAKGDVTQTDADRLRDALNPTLAQGAAGANYWGTMDLHLIELRTSAGLKALWVSNRARLANANEWFGDANHNFNLYVADWLPDGSLGQATQFNHFTTTSALSPTPLRDGFAFSYQSSTEDGRRWDIQRIDSEGRWGSLLGYAHSSELFHLGTLVVERGAGGALVDSFIGVKYYNSNNEGFGQLHSIRLEDTGVNELVQGPWGLSPRQLSELMTLGVIATDLPSSQVLVDGHPRYVGKFSSPRAGRLGGEYFMAYTPTSANVPRRDADGLKGVYESEIRYRPSLAPFEAHEPVDVANGTGLYSVVRDASAEYDLIWPTPLLSWLERTGEPQQRIAKPLIEAPIPRGTPHAEVGTSALWNSDIRPYECYLLPGRVFEPNALDSNEVVQVLHSQEGLRYVQDASEPCQYLLPETVLGVAVQLTSQRTDFLSLNARGYETDGTSKVESTRQLGFFSVLEENEADQSFKARVPSDVPFELQLLDRRYGMKLADVRSWHSLRPRESRTNCGGCHQHEAGLALPFEGTEAARRPAFDMTEVTTFVDYDADCRPVVQSAPSPTLPTPEWTADVWPGFDQHCGDCHDVARSADTAALIAFDYGTEEDAYDKMRARNYANSVLGALGSPAFWAAYGERTDGRDNDLPAYQPDYANQDWGYHFGAIHATSPGLCAASDPEWASWVRRFGQWIDNHMPRDTGATVFDYQYDRYAPTLDFALDDARAALVVGVWDDGGTVALTVELDGSALTSLESLTNGSTTVALPAEWTPLDSIRVVVQDPAGNRQTRVKTLAMLIQEQLGQSPRALAGPRPAASRPSVRIAQPLAGSEHAAGAPFDFAGSATDVEDGNLSTELAWSSDREGPLGQGASFRTALTEPGTHRIRASVTDSSGRVGTAEVEVTVQLQNASPMVAVLAPSSGSTFTVASPVQFLGQVSDVEDDDNTLTSALAWNSSLDGALGSGAALTTSTLTPGVHVVTAAVTDSGGATGSAMVTLTIQAAQPGLPTAGLVLRLESGAGVSVSGNTVTGWADQSGQGNHLAALGGPTLAASLTPSGRPALVLDGANDRLERVHSQAPLQGLPSGNADRSLFAVVRYHGASWSGGVAYGNGGINQAFGVGVRHTNGVLMLQGFGSDLDSTTPGLGAGWLVQGAELSSGVATLLANGAPIAQWTHDYGTVLSKLVIGQEIAQLGFETMDVAAVLLYDRALSPTERGEVDAYLQAVYLGPGNATPTVAIQEPSPGSEVPFGQAVQLVASAQDAEDGDLSAALVWSSDRDGALGTGGSLSVTTLSIGPHRLTAAVTDGGGQSGSASVDMAVIGTGAITPTSPLQLFDRQSLTGLQPWFSGSGNSDPEQVFRVEGGLLRVTGQSWGGLETQQEYRDYVLVLEYKWGQLTWAPRQTAARDGGLLLHSHGAPGEWLGLLRPALQVQMMEGSTGDFILLQGSAPMAATCFSEQIACTFSTWNCRGGYRWNAGGLPRQLAGLPETTVHWQHWDPDWVDELGFRGDEDLDSPYGDWNQLVVIAAGDSVRTFLNGAQVNEALAVHPSEGRIQLESEFAEYFVRRFELLPPGSPVGPTIATDALSSAVSQSNYVDGLVAVGGLAPRTWAITGGALPAGIALDPTTGALSGTPSVAGSHAFIARVTDAQGLAAEEAFVLEVAPAGASLPTQGLVLRLESTEFSDNGPVISWSDQSGLGNHVFAVGGPTVLTGATPSGAPALVFAGLNDKLERLHATQPLSGLPTGNADRSMFFVVRYDASSASAGVAYGHGANNQAFGLMVRDPSGFLALQGFGGPQDLVSSTPGTGAGWLTQSTVLAGGQARLFKGGTVIAQWTHDYATALTRLVVGEELIGLGFVDMRVAAVLLYDRALSEGERATVEAYLADTYLR